MARKKKSSALSFLILALIAGAGYIAGHIYWKKNPGGFHAKKETYEMAPDFEYADLQGRRSKLSDFRGKVVLVDFWATWCGPCVEELPEIKEVYQRYKEEGFEVLGVSIDEGDKSEVAAYVREYSVPFPILLAGGLDGVPEGYQIRAIPTAFLIDREGRIRKKFLGYKIKEELMQAIEEVLRR